MELRQRRLLLWAGLGLAVALGLALAFRPRAVPVDLVAAEHGTLTVTIDEEGKTRVSDVFVLSAPLAGQTRRIEAEVGDPVSAGETVVVEIRPITPEFLDARSESEAAAAVRAAEAARDTAAAELERVRAELDYARTERGRYRRLMESGVASAQQLDQAERQYRTARAAVETARAALQERSFELDRAEARLVSPLQSQAEEADCDACIPVRAPVSGRVLRVLHESEGVVQPGQPLIEIGDPRDLEIVVDLLSADAVRVEPGQVVHVEEWGGEGRLAGVVRRVEPYGFTKVSALGIEEQRVNVIVDFADAPERWKRLGHGYRVETRIVVWEQDGVLKLPLSSLFRHGEEWAVFVVEGGRARLRSVERGRHNGLEAQILSGLEAEERVVLYPSDRVADGVRVAGR